MRSLLKWLNGCVSLGLVMLIAYWLWKETRVYEDWGWFLVLAPSFLAVAWLRITGIRWRFALLFPGIAVLAYLAIRILGIMYALLTSD